MAQASKNRSLADFEKVSMVLGWSGMGGGEGHLTTLKKNKHFKIILNSFLAKIIQSNPVLPFTQFSPLVTF